MQHQQIVRRKYMPGRFFVSPFREEYIIEVAKEMGNVNMRHLEHIKDLVSQHGLLGLDHPWKHFSHSMLDLNGVADRCHKKTREHHGTHLVEGIDVGAHSQHQYAGNQDLHRKHQHAALPQVHPINDAYSCFLVSIRCQVRSSTNGFYLPNILW